MQLAAGILAMHLTLGSAIRSGAHSDTNRRDYRHFACFCRADDAVFLSNMGGMDQRHNRSVAGSKPLGSEYQCSLVGECLQKSDVLLLERSHRRRAPPDRRKQGPIQFLENNPIQSSFWVRFMCPKTRRNWLRLPIVRFHPGSSCPPSSRPEAKPHPRPKATAISARSRVSWHTVNLRSAASSAIIRTSEHFHVFSPPPRLSVRMFGSGGKKRANASSNCAAL